MGPRLVSQPEGRDRRLTVLALRTSEEIRRRDRFAASRKPTRKLTLKSTPATPHRFRLSDATVTGTLRIPVPNVETQSKLRSPLGAANPKGLTTTKSTEDFEVTKPQAPDESCAPSVTAPCSIGTGIPISCGPVKTLVSHLLRSASRESDTFCRHYRDKPRISVLDHVR